MKFMAEDTYLLSSYLLPCDLVDGADTQHLNNSHHTITHPFQKDFNIKSYNETHSSSPLLLTPLKFDNNYEYLTFVHSSSSEFYLYVIEFHSKTHPFPLSLALNLSSVSTFLHCSPTELFALIITAA